MVVVGLRLARVHGVVMRVPECELLVAVVLSGNLKCQLRYGDHRDIGYFDCI